jgi:hypothetical protein
MILGIFLSLASIVSAQAPDTLWTRTFGGEDVEMPTWIEPAHDGGFVISGYTRSFDVDYDDMYIVKINPMAVPVGRTLMAIRGQMMPTILRVLGMDAM